MKIIIGDDQSTSSCSFVGLSLAKPKPATIIKAAIAIVLVTAISIVGWQIHLNVDAKHNNQPSRSSSSYDVNVIETNHNQSFTAPPTISATLSPTQKPTIISDQRLKYLSQFSDSPNVTYSNLRTYLPIWKKRIMKMESEIKIFMDQKMAIEKLFRNIDCDDHPDMPFQEWYLFVLKSKPRIDLDTKTNTITWKIDNFDYDEVCDSSNGLITYLLIDYTFCKGQVDFSSLPDSLTTLEIYDEDFIGTVDFTSLPESLRKLKVDKCTFGGPIDLTSLPPFLNTLHLENNRFNGSVDLSSLPNSLQNLSLAANQFSGSVDLSQLIHYNNLTILNLEHNKFNGSIDLTMLPNNGKLKVARFAYNQFAGTIDLTSLPQSLKELTLHKNQFTGTVDLTSLPDLLSTVELHENQLTGTVNLTLLPQTLELLDVSDNNLTGTVDLTSLSESLQSTFFRRNQFSGTVDLTTLPKSLIELVLCENQFNGTVDLSSLPESLETLWLHSNQFTGTADLTKMSLSSYMKLDWSFENNQFDQIIRPTNF